jgi:hypothetical protein
LRRAAPFSIYEYHDDLDLRSIIQDVLDRVPEVRRTSESKTVVDLDTRFMKATVDVKQVIATRVVGPWASRVPSRPGQELNSDLESRGLSALSEGDSGRQAEPERS